MRRDRRIAAATIVAGAVASVGGLVAPAAQGATGEIYRYVALGGAYVVGPEFAAKVVHHETGVATAPLGSVDFESTSSSFTLTIDDLGAPDGSTVAVSIVERSPAGQQAVTLVCIAVRETTSFVTAPGNTVGVSVWNPTTSQHCSARATTGTITLER